MILLKLICYGFLELLFPRKCILCRQLLSKDETDLCTVCRREAPWFPTLGELNREKLTHRFLDSYCAVWYYENNVRKSLLRYKFHRGFAMAPAYGRLLCSAVRRDYGDTFDVITWVPVSRRRRFKRGYDQSRMLAQAFCREYGHDCMALLQKIRSNAPQSSLSAEARKGNVLGVYRAIHPEQIRGKRILLVDDIVTTGATAEECARVLLTAGAKSVYLAAMAGGRKQH